LTKRIPIRASKKGLSALGIAGALGLLLWCGVDRYTTQVNNYIRLDLYARQVERLRMSDGRYPAQFVGADFFGRDVLYRATADHFILVSFGKDGEPDTDYSDWMSAPLPTRTWICLNPDRDTVILDTGTVAACGK